MFFLLFLAGLCLCDLVYDFQFVSQVIISNDDGPKTNTDVLIEIDSETLISTNRMKENCEDLMFYDESDSDSYDFWIEHGCNTPRMQVWVTIPTIPNGDSIIHMYYGYRSGSVQYQGTKWWGNFMFLTMQDTCSGEFEEFTDAAGKYLAAGNNYGDLGGSNYHSHRIKGTISGISDFLGISSRVTLSDSSTSFGDIVPKEHDHSYDFLTNEALIEPSYAAYTICYGTSEHSFTSVPFGYYVFLDLNVEIDDGFWVVDTQFEGLYPRAKGDSINAGSVGGDTIHRHTSAQAETSVLTAKVYCTWDSANERTTEFADNNHDHYINLITNYANHAPPYIRTTYLKSTTDDSSYFQEGMIVAANLPPPKGWTLYDNFIDTEVVFPVPHDCSIFGNCDGNSEGSSTHTHSGTFYTGTAADNFFQAAKCNPYSGSYIYTGYDSHYHRSEYSVEGENFPEFFTMKYYIRSSSLSASIGEETALYWSCFDIQSTNSKSCNDGSGICVYPDICNCTYPYFGKECKERILDTDVEMGKEDGKKVIRIGYETTMLLLEEYDLEGSFSCDLITPNYQKLGASDSSFCTFQVDMFYTTYLDIYLGKNAEIKRGDSIYIRPMSSLSSMEDVEDLVKIRIPEQGLSVIAIFALTTWWILPTISLLACCFVCCVLGCFCFCGIIYLKNRQDLKKFDQLEDFDQILEEQKAEKEEKVIQLKVNKKLFEIEYSSVKLVKVIGEGGSGAIVYKAKWQGNLVAFKVFKTSLVLNEEGNFKDFESEVSLISSLSHPNILIFYGCSLKAPRIGILMEFCCNGDMEKYIRTNPIPTFTEKLRFLNEIAAGCSFLHSKNVIHRDLKFQNVLLNDKLTPKIMDFGLSRIAKMDGKMTKCLGTSVYMAPEVTLGKIYDEKVDVFSFGIMMFEILTENLNPYKDILDEGKNVEMTVANNPNCRPKFTSRQINLYQGDEKFIWFIKLMKRAWSDDPFNRPSFGKIIKSFNEFLEKNGEEGKHDAFSSSSLRMLGLPEKEIQEIETKVEKYKGKLRKLQREERIVSSQLEDTDEKIEFYQQIIDGKRDISEMHLLKKSTTMKNSSVSRFFSSSSSMNDKAEDGGDDDNTPSWKKM